VTAFDSDAALDELECQAFTYFLHEVDSDTGLVRDNTRVGVPASIAGSGFALACYAVGAERGYLTREDATERVHRALRFLWEAPQGDGPEETGSHGLFYHYLAPESGRRLWASELSTIDTAIMIAGALTAGRYFVHDTPIERDIRRFAAALYERVNWGWACGGGRTVTHGWRPEAGFLAARWQGYSEALILYILGLGSPTHPLLPDSYLAWAETYDWRSLYGRELLYAGPLFIHHLSQCWIDCRGIQDEFMRAHGIDYFENSRRAAYVQREYARRNPRGWKGYSATHWGITASDGPGSARRVYAGRRRTFYGYHARGAPFGPDDGTLSPWSVAASLPFAPEIVLPSLAATDEVYPQARHDYGYTGSFNPSFPVHDRLTGRDHQRRRGIGWTSPAHYAINQGPVVLMVENYRSGLVWQLMRDVPSIRIGLERAGFRGGWLG
jgi:hypothetical protein